MKVYYINILLFALTLNILVNIKMNHNITILHTPPNRSLCECELYAPANYDNDPQMKKVMDNFNKQTQQRLHEYDDRMMEKRKQCKDRCDKEIQKIILKDKLEKQMAQQLTTLETKIDTDDIPTCICEKSIADKVEKRCLQCGSMLGGTLPELGLMGGTALYTLNAWKVAALKYAIVAAKKAGAVEGAVAGNAQGMDIVIAGLRALGVEELGIGPLKSFFTKGYNINVEYVANIIADKHGQICGFTATYDGTMCRQIGFKIGTHLENGLPDGPPARFAVTPKLEGILNKATQGANAEATQVAAAKTATIKAAQEKAIETTFMGNQTIIIASIVAIVVIVLIMVIIYLILRYRRKKKMKKKLQYIKLLEE